MCHPEHREGSDNIHIYVFEIFVCMYSVFGALFSIFNRRISVSQRGQIIHKQITQKKVHGEAKKVSF